MIPDEQCLNAGDRVRIVAEPGNPHDECAVAVTLVDGRKIGYVPRTDSEDVSGCIGDGGYYVATVTKILTGGRMPVPVILLQFYRPDQRADIADLHPDPCSTASPAPTMLRSLGNLLAIAELFPGVPNCFAQKDRPRRQPNQQHDQVIRRRPGMFLQRR